MCVCLCGQIVFSARIEITSDSHSFFTGARAHSVSAARAHALEGARAIARAVRCAQVRARYFVPCVRGGGESGGWRWANWVR